MAFSIVGLGVRDSVTLDNLFEHKVIEQTNATTPIKPVGDHTQQQRQPSAEAAKATSAYKNVAQQKEPQPAIIARQIMRSPVTTLTESASLLEAWNLFRETRYRHIPIVNVHGVLTGLVSDRDLLRYAATSGHVPPYDENSAEAKLSIRDLMRTRVLTASPETEIRFIARVLIEQRIGVMPIVNEQSEPLGMITRSDILRTIIHHSELELWV